MSLQTFEHLKPIVLPVLSHYQDDLVKHDYGVLKIYDGPFVYGYRKTGTDLLLMKSTIDDYSWHRPLTLEEMQATLEESLICIDYQSHNTHFLHFDGSKLINKAAKELKEVWLSHVDKIIQHASQQPLPC